MKTTHLIHLGKNIRTLREYRKLSQMQLSELSGVQQADIHRIESGQRNPTINTLVKLASALNCAIDIQFKPLK